MKTVGIAALAAVIAIPAVAQENCAAFPEVASALVAKYGEGIVGQGLYQGTILQMWANPETGTWTIVIVRPDGIACIPASGDNWEAVEPEPAGLRL